MTSANVAVHAERAGGERGVRELLGAVFGRSAEADLVDRLRARGDGTLLVAESSDAIVGQIAFNPVELIGAHLEKPAIALGLLAVHPNWRSRGIGGRLVVDGLSECRRRGFGLSIVIGPPLFYRRFGFASAVPFGMRCRWRVAPELFQVVELAPGELARAKGIVRYSAEYSS